MDYLLLAYSILLTVYIAWRYMMARGLPYSPEEDDILLSTDVTADIQAKLAAAGYPERSANAIKARRSDLRRNNGTSRFRSARPASEMVRAATEFETAKAEVARLQEQLKQAEVAMAASRKRLATVLAKEG